MIKIEPQPPKNSIKYMIDNPRRLVCEEWGNCGCAILDPAINGCRLTHIQAPPGVTGFMRVTSPTDVEGEYYWTNT